MIGIAESSVVVEQDRLRQATEKFCRHYFDHGRLLICSILLLKQDKQDVKRLQGCVWTNIVSCQKQCNIVFDMVTRLDSVLNMMSSIHVDFKCNMKSTCTQDCNKLEF
jgi:hypothetical protein